MLFRNGLELFTGVAQLSLKMAVMTLVVRGVGRLFAFRFAAILRVKEYDKEHGIHTLLTPGLDQQTHALRSAVPTPHGNTGSLDATPSVRRLSQCRSQWRAQAASRHHQDVLARHSGWEVKIAAQVWGVVEGLCFGGHDDERRSKAFHDPRAGPGV